MIYTRHPPVLLGAEGRRGRACKERRELTSVPSTLNGPVYEESPWAVSDIVEPAIVTVLQDPQEKKSPQSVERARLTSTSINQHYSLTYPDLSLTSPVAKRNSAHLSPHAVTNPAWTF